MKTIEKSLLQLGLTLAICYQLFQTVVHLFEQRDLFIILFDLVLAFSFLALLYWAKNYSQSVAFAFHLIILFAFAFLWVNTTGFYEAVPDLMCVYVAFIVVVSVNYLRTIALALHLSLIFMLLYYEEMFSFMKKADFTTASHAQLSIEYGVVALLMVIFSAYMKNAYQAYHDKGVKRFRQLQSVDATLARQIKELIERKKEVSAINENLEDLVRERTAETERKNHELAEYAFINAHMVRGPLSRVIGLANLMERNPELYNPDEVSSIKKVALEMDLIVKEINKALN